MKNPMVSIVIPVYNGSNYMREAIDSALAQTYDSLEVIVVNDGSTDGTETIAQSYGDDIRYFAKENGNIGTALNMGIEKMRGEYFTILAHDDVYYPDKIENQINAILKSGDMTRICWGDLDALNEKSEVIGHYRFSQRIGKSLLTDSVLPVIESFVAICAPLVHKSHFDRVGVFDPKRLYTHDNELWFRMFRNQRTVYVDLPLYKMRLHPEADTSAKVKEIIPYAADLRLGWIRAMTDDEILRMYGEKAKFYAAMYKKIKLACGKEAAERVYDIVREKEAPR
jgi:glycosyltransferase involved in cell wall biosynthesis